LREIDVQHPAAKSVIELARVQDEEVGDGTTSVIIMTGELMLAARPFMEMNLHPTVVVSAYYKALEFAKRVLNTIAVPIDITKDEEVIKALQSCIGTKFASRWGHLIADLTIKATKTIMRQGTKNKLNLELKRYARVEKIPGGTLEECEVLDGVMVNKDITHPKMRRQIRNPRIILLDCPLEYKKGESQTNMELKTENAMCEALEQEMEEIAHMCNNILKWKPDIVITEKGVSDLAQHFLLKGGKEGVSVIRRIRKTDNVRIARVSGAKIVNRPEELQESDVGTECGLFDIRKIGDDYFSFFVECKAPTACSIILRGASKDVLNEMERNLHDCLGVSKNLYTDPRLVPGGGASEMEISARLNEEADKSEGIEQLPFRAGNNYLT
jgi:T-complex protein 1 subunit gamma